MKAHYTGVSRAAEVELHLFPGGYAGLAPVEGGRVNLCALLYPPLLGRGRHPTGAGAGERERGARRLLAEALARSPHLAARVGEGRMLPDTVAATAPVAVSTRGFPADAPPRVDAPPRLGDGAAMLPPLAGEGMTMALRSALLCAEAAHGFLAGRLSRSQWHTVYAQAWQQSCGPPLAAARRLEGLLSRPWLAAGLLVLGRRAPALVERLLAATRSRGPGGARWTP